jgi:hypothetical protein
MRRVKTHTHVFEPNAGRYREPPFDSAKCVLTASALAGCCRRGCAPSACVQERFGTGKQVGMHQVDHCTSLGSRKDDTELWNPVRTSPGWA